MLLSIVVPVYKEEKNIPEFLRRIRPILSGVTEDYEIIFSLDPSPDRTEDVILAARAADSRIKLLRFSRRFGQPMATLAGLEYSSGEAVIAMDVDLQDPPELIHEMVAKWREGFDVVYGRRQHREAETWFKLFTAKMFYRFFAAMVPIEVPLDTGDFRLMSRRVVVALRALKETHRFVRGMVAWVGFKQTAVLYDRAGRAAGETKYPLKKMLKFAADGITSFSILPLRASSYLGLIISVLSVVMAVWAMVAHFVYHATVPGWTASIVTTSLLAAVQLMMIGILGEYVGRIYEQVKGRPLYLVGEVLNMGRQVDNDDVEDDAHDATHGR